MLFQTHLSILAPFLLAPSPVCYIHLPGLLGHLTSAIVRVAVRSTYTFTASLQEWCTFCLSVNEDYSITLRDFI